MYNLSVGTKDTYVMYVVEQWQHKKTIKNRNVVNYTQNGYKQSGMRA